MLSKQVIKRAATEFYSRLSQCYLKTNNLYDLSLLIWSMALGARQLENRMHNAWQLIADDLNFMGNYRQELNRIG